MRELSAWATPGGGLFDDFLREVAFMLGWTWGLEANAVAGEAVVRELEKLSRIRFSVERLI